VADVDPETFDLSVKNPNAPEEAPLRDPQEIMDEIAALDRESAEILAGIGGMNDYLYYIIPTEFVRGELMKRAERSLIPSMSVKHLAQVKIPVPPIAEQKQIVAILDEAFEGIDSAIANTKKNLANARELFESYLNAIFTRKGEGWIEKRLDKICSIKHGFAFKGEFFTNEETDYVVLTPGSFYESGGYRDQGPKTKYYTGEIPEDYILSEGDFLFAMTSTPRSHLPTKTRCPQRTQAVDFAKGVLW
jgi:type I restriction enzyme S subunit